MSIFSDMLSSKDYYQYMSLPGWLWKYRKQKWYLSSVNKNHKQNKILLSVVKLDLTSYTIEITNWIGFPTTGKGPSDQPMVS